MIVMIFFILIYHNNQSNQRTIPMPEQQLTTQHQEIELRSEEVEEFLGRIPH